jgi:hypothetical protein
MTMATRSDGKLAKDVADYWRDAAEQARSAKQWSRDARQYKGADVTEQMARNLDARLEVLEAYDARLQMRFRALVDRGADMSRNPLVARAPATKQ